MEHMQWEWGLGICTFLPPTTFPSSLGQVLGCFLLYQDKLVPFAQGGDQLLGEPHSIITLCPQSIGEASWWGPLIYFQSRY